MWKAIASALAVGVHREQDRIRLAGDLSQLPEHGALALDRHVFGFEPPLHVDAEPAPWQIPDVPNRCLDGESVAEIGLQRARLRGRLHDYEIHERCPASVVFAVSVSVTVTSSAPSVDPPIPYLRRRRDSSAATSSGPRPSVSTDSSASA